MLEQSIADEVEAAIAAGSAEKHLETIRRVTDLFLLSADGFSGEQIELFGDVLERLIKTIEIRALADVSARIALAEMSTQLASVKQAPPAVVRRLARHDEITIAGPVLTESARLTPEDLVELAQTKGEKHLLAISGRWWLSEVVTDALLARHYPSVSRRVVGNPGAKVSAEGFADRAAAGRNRSRAGGRRPASGSTCRLICGRNYCTTPPKRCGRGCCRARRRICSRKSATRSRPPSEGAGREMAKPRDFAGAQRYVASLAKSGHLNEAGAAEFCQAAKIRGDRGRARGNCRDRTSRSSGR